MNPVPIPPPFDLLVATTNPGKVREIRAYLPDYNCLIPPADLVLEETGDTFAENARMKATQAALALETWAIADDSGLAVESLDGAPGVFSARYGHTDGERIERLLFELGDERERSARFICVVAVANPQGEIVAQAEGVCGGEILLAPRGTGGFGYDPIFYVPAQGLTFAQMTPAQKQQVSHRGQALQALVLQLQHRR
ncbi:RdgB/HAM1 family non-canonical purine NTP pyrophosphatase [Gloeomargarita lithophora Alchichica-D10]|uniref:dITP/XTP pyrophosphatase n=1 Tax=Gloeomargarita lithophora Alchichica-D10 TaxID=1188229 RepID=A0A1J0AGW9_9CYAN|nr:RdgB/HAM1 family non-canonical purine NTP pyrophosphatase [Gloeomargarita lithophora]APB35193.1 RdgB/HAM1 family non-canonical purine NTP pyrophosphatase [Gloeomargarita lithophora Alchichica-D10]